MKKMIISIILVLAAGQIACAADLEHKISREDQMVRAFNKTKRDGYAPSAFMTGGLMLLTTLATHEAMGNPTHQSRSIAETSGLLTLCSIGIPIYKLAQNLRTVPGIGGFFSRYGQSLWMTLQHWTGLGSLNERSKALRRQERSDIQQGKERIAGMAQTIETLGQRKDFLQQEFNRVSHRNSQLEGNSDSLVRELQKLREEQDKKNEGARRDLQKTSFLEQESKKLHQRLKELEKERDTAEEQHKTSREQYKELQETTLQFRTTALTVTNKVNTENKGLKAQLHKELEKYRMLQDKFESFEAESIDLRVNSEKDKKLAAENQSLKSKLQKLAQREGIPVKAVELMTNLELQQESIKDLEKEIAKLRQNIMNLLKHIPLKLIPENDRIKIASDLGISASTLMSSSSVSNLTRQRENELIEENRKLQEELGKAISRGDGYKNCILKQASKSSSTSSQSTSSSNSPSSTTTCQGCSYEKESGRFAQTFQHSCLSKINYPLTTGSSSSSSSSSMTSYSSPPTALRECHCGNRQCRECS